MTDASHAGIAQWLKAIRDHPRKPPVAQCHVLTMLALRLSWRDGTGYAGEETLAADAGVDARTARRALRWAQSEGLVERTRRGHRLGDGHRIASEWRRTMPADADLNQAPATGRDDLNGSLVSGRDGLNRTAEPSQPDSTHPPSSLSASSRIEDPRSATPAEGRGRVPFAAEHVLAASRPSAASEKNPSVDARLTGSAASDLIAAAFSDPVEREMASEFVKVLRASYSVELIIKAAGFWFAENSYVLMRGIGNPRAYARKRADSVCETLDGWKDRDERYRRICESRAREAAQRRACEERRQLEAAEHEARGEVKVELLALDEYWDGPEWLPRDQATQVPFGGVLVWVPSSRAAMVTG